jgi:hypothetical protein
MQSIKQPPLDDWLNKRFGKQVSAKTVVVDERFDIFFVLFCLIFLFI